MVAKPFRNFEIGRTETSNPEIRKFEIGLAGSFLLSSPHSFNLKVLEFRSFKFPFVQFQNSPCRFLFPFNI